MYARAKTREYPIDMAQIKNVWWKIEINNTTSPTTTPNTLITGVCVLFIYLFFNLGEKTGITNSNTSVCHFIAWSNVSFNKTKSSLSRPERTLFMKIPFFLDHRSSRNRLQRSQPGSLIGLFGLTQRYHLQRLAFLYCILSACLGLQPC